MGKRNKNRAVAKQNVQQNSGVSAEAFSFGDPIPVLDRRELLDYVECVQMDCWYEPPVALTGWHALTAPPCITARQLRSNATS